MLPIGSSTAWPRWNAPLAERSPSVGGPSLADVLGEVPSRFVLGSEEAKGVARENNFRAMQAAEAAGVAVMPEGVDPMPYLQSPSDLFMAYESTIDVAMQELRRFRGKLRDAEWETNNGDQIVQSLLTLSKVCLSCAEKFVLRQESKQSPLKAAEHAAAAAIPLAPPSLTPELGDDDDDNDEAIEAGGQLEDASTTQNRGDADQQETKEAREEGDGIVVEDGEPRIMVEDEEPCTDADADNARQCASPRASQGDDGNADVDAACEETQEDAMVRGALGKSVSIDDEASGDIQQTSRTPHRRARSITTVRDSIALRRALSEACVADLHAAGIPAQLQSLKRLKRVVNAFEAVADQWKRVETRASSKWAEVSAWNGVYLTPSRQQCEAATDREWLVKVIQSYSVEYQPHDEASEASNKAAVAPLKDVLEEFVSSMMKREGHPLCTAVHQYVCYFRERYCSAQGSKASTSTKESFASMVEDVHAFVATAARGLLTTFPELSSLDLSGMVRQAVSTQVVTALHPSIWPLYLLHYQHEEEVLYDKIRLLKPSAKRPECLGLLERFTIVSPGHDFLFPDAVALLRELPFHDSPVQKLRCLCDVLRNLCFSIEDFYRRNIFTSIAIGGEDLLSLFIYVVVVAEEMGMYSQSKFLQDFVDASMLLGSEGYALATLETAVNIVASSRPEQPSGQELLQNQVQEEPLGE